MAENYSLFENVINFLLGKSRVSTEMRIAKEKLDLLYKSLNAKLKQCSGLKNRNIEEIQSIARSNCQLSHEEIMNIPRIRILGKLVIHLRRHETVLCDAISSVTSQLATMSDVRVAEATNLVISEGTRALSRVDLSETGAIADRSAVVQNSKQENVAELSVADDVTDEEQFSLVKDIIADINIKMLAKMPSTPFDYAECRQNVCNPEAA